MEGLGGRDGEVVGVDGVDDDDCEGAMSVWGGGEMEA